MKKITLILLVLLSCFAFACSDDDSPKSDVEKLCSNIEKLSDKFDVVFTWTYNFQDVQYTSYQICINDQQAMLDAGKCTLELQNLQKCEGDINIKKLNSTQEFFDICERYLTTWGTCMENIANAN